MGKLTKETLVAKGYSNKKHQDVFSKGELSIMHHEGDFFLNHEEPFDFQVRTVERLELVEKALTRNIL